jgi:hypothetical protein
MAIQADVGYERWRSAKNIVFMTASARSGPADRRIGSNADGLAVRFAPMAKLRRPIRSNKASKP